MGHKRQCLIYSDTPPISNVYFLIRMSVSSLFLFNLKLFQRKPVIRCDNMGEPLETMAVYRHPPLYEMNCILVVSLQQFNEQKICKLGLFRVSYFKSVCLRNLEHGWIWQEVVETTWLTHKVTTCLIQKLCPDMTEYC